MIRIGVPAQNHDDKFGVNVNYLEFISQFGHPIVILPCKPEEFTKLYSIDALLLPGGADIDSRKYSLVPAFANYAPNIYLEHFDNHILPLLVGNIPIFGICRGLQSLNVFFGGTLQNLIWHPYSNSETHEAHKIVVYNNGMRPHDFNDKKTPKVGVNSFHHQAIDIIAKNFQIEAESEYGGVIEAISDYKKKIFAVQWHPERLLDTYSIKAFKSIL